MRKLIPITILLGMLILLLSCQNDVETKQATAKIGLDADAKAIQIANAEKEKVSVDGDEANPDDEIIEDNGEPELIEFYVEEKKKEKKETKATETKEEASSTKVAVNTKPVEEKPKKKAKPKKAVGKMTFDSDVFKFGRIKPGEIIEHKFEFTNTGKGDLIIKDAKVSCGCTHPSYPFIPIKPGERGYIGVRYDSSGKLGSQKPTVTLTTNGYPATKKIYLEGLVISEMAKQ